MCLSNGPTAVQYRSPRCFIVCSSGIGNIFATIWKQILDPSRLWFYSRIRLEALAALWTAGFVHSPASRNVTAAAGCDSSEHRRECMASGKIKWWDNKKGFGFIAQDSGQDVFVHYSAVAGQGFKVLNEGDAVTFDIVASDKGPK